VSDIAGRAADRNEVIMHQIQTTVGFRGFGRENGLLALKGGAI